MYRTSSVFPEPGLRRDSADHWLTSQMLSPSVPQPQSSRSVLSLQGAANAEQSFIVYCSFKYRRVCKLPAHKYRKRGSL